MQPRQPHHHAVLADLVRRHELPKRVGDLLVALVFVVGDRVADVFDREDLETLLGRLQLDAFEGGLADVQSPNCHSPP